jgi:hypothetical protein
MPSLDAVEPASETIKLLLMGHSGTGKTSSLASLAKAGYRVFLADFENGYQILLDEKILPKEFRKNIILKQFFDKRIGILALPVNNTPTAASKFFDAINIDWKDEVSYGNIYKWTDKDVLVIDSLTMLCEAIEQQVLYLNQRLVGKDGAPGRLQIQDYLTAQEILHGMFQMLCSPAVPCHVVVIAHLRQLEEASSGMKWFPQATGKKISPLIGRYFNNVVQTIRTANGELKFATQATSFADMKISKPSKVPAEMPPDLGKLFSLLRS